LFAAPRDSYCSYHRYLPKPKDINFTKYRRIFTIYCRYDASGKLFHISSIEFLQDNVCPPKQAGKNVSCEPNLTSKLPHEVLGVSFGASAEEIRQAYRKLSLLHHPDKNPDDSTAHSRFIKVKNAYEALISTE
jgi:hypothetical protein